LAAFDLSNKNKKDENKEKRQDNKEKVPDIKEPDVKVTKDNACVVM
jgi:glycerophosphoryl diester phosphodiesterase